MLNFRLILTKYQCESLENHLQRYLNQGQLTLVNRIRSILSIANGVELSMIAQVLQVNVQSIRDWLSKYLCGGIRSLVRLKKRQGRPSKLYKNQKKQLKQWLINGPASEGFPGACWRTSP